MKRIAVGSVGAGPSAAVTSLIRNFSLLILVVVSTISAIRAVAGALFQMEKMQDVVAIGVLAMILIPTGAIIFWGCNAVILLLSNLTRQSLSHYLWKHDRRPAKSDRS